MTADESDSAQPHNQILRALTSEIAELRDAGVWREGHKTLLGALGLHHNEVVICRGLAWLLTPDAWHGLGTAVLDELLSRCGVDAEDSARAAVVVEEVRKDTRADIVIRTGAATLLIEAKIGAGEQAQQCDRLARHWADEMPILIFLTRTGAMPRSAVASDGTWLPLSWSEIAELIETAVEGRTDLDVGVQEYLRSVKTIGRNADVADDTKLDFYLRHRTDIEELVDLSVRARTTLEKALIACAKSLGDDAPPGLEIKRSIINIPLRENVWVELHWSYRPLFKGESGWPHLVVVVNPKYPALQTAVLSATAFTIEQFGLHEERATRWWLRSGPFPPEEEPLDFEAYAAACVDRLIVMWAAVRPVVEGLSRDHD